MLAGYASNPWDYASAPKPRQEARPFGLGYVKPWGNSAVSNLLQAPEPVPMGQAAMPGVPDTQTIPAAPPAESIPQMVPDAQTIQSVLAYLQQQPTQTKPLMIPQRPTVTKPLVPMRPTTRPVNILK